MSTSADGLSTEMAPRKVHWFRSTVFQVVVVGGVFFCAPGMSNALGALGAGGLATPWFANTAAAVSYIFMAIFCITGGVIVSKIGVRLSLLISSTGEIFYAGGFYLNSKNGTQWVLLLGAIVSGITDGLMYAVEGPIITAYPEPHRQGRMLGLWVLMRNAGPVLGGVSIFALNIKSDFAGGISLKTYLVLIAVMCCAPFVALLLSPPEKVQRRDGVKIVFRKLSWERTMYELYRVISSPDILLLCPLFFTSWFCGPYIGTLRTQYFNIRSRSLCALATPWSSIASGFLTGYFLDHTKLSVKRRARSSFVILMVLNLVLWIWTAFITKQLEDQNAVIDWTSGSMFIKTFTLFISFEFVTMATQTSLYWIIGHMSDDFMVLSYMTGTLRGVESAGQAMAYSLNFNSTNNSILIGLNIGLIIFSLPFSWATIRKIGARGFKKMNFGIDKQRSYEQIPLLSD